MNIAQYVGGDWRKDLSTKEESEEGMCSGCGKVAINNAADELCPECLMEKLADQADRWGEGVETTESKVFAGGE